MTQRGVSGIQSRWTSGILVLALTLTTCSAPPAPPPSNTPTPVATPNPTATPVPTQPVPVAPATAPAPTATPSPAPPSRPTAAPTATALAPAPAPPTPTPAETAIQIVEPAGGDPQQWTFRPGSVTVRVGARVTWTNTGSNFHTVTADSNVFDSGVVNVGERFATVLQRPGTVAYHCDFHPWMKGTLVVQGP